MQLKERLGRLCSLMIVFLVVSLCERSHAKYSGISGSARDPTKSHRAKEKSHRAVEKRPLALANNATSYLAQNSEPNSGS